MDNSFNTNFRRLGQNNWPYNSNLQPQFSNPNLKNVPLYHAPSDPRFKQTTSNEIPTSLPNQPEKSDDELWVERYLLKIGKSLPTPNIIQKPPKKHLQVHAATGILQRCNHLLQNLQKTETYLRENVATMTSAEWKEKTIEIGQQKDEFSNLLSQFDNSTLEHLKKTLKQRKKKRLLHKFKKQRLRAEHEGNLKKRECINKNIDSWLEKMKTDVEKAKQEELLKKDADCILSEVTKKKSDARKQLTLLSAMVKLRSVRQHTAEINGHKLNLEDADAFVKNTEKLKNMWENALATYSKEEQSLKVMLESNAANDVHTAVSKEKKIVMDWETVLFGPKIIPSDAYWALMCAEKDIRTFIAIRKSWDTFLVPEENPEGSRIPIGWVLPKTDNWFQPQK